VRYRKGLSPVVKSSVRLERFKDVLDDGGAESVGITPLTFSEAGLLVQASIRPRLCNRI